MKRIMYVCSLVILCSYFFSFDSIAAEVSKGMTTITVDASDNESQDLMYAIDSDAPDAFTSSNEFVVEAGTSHTVYVKDAAGNISGQVITAPIEKVDIEVTIGQHGTDTEINYDDIGDAIEPGGGEIDETTITDGSSSAEKIFYTITTANDNVFYMVIDNTRSADNVYLLNQVTEDDLLHLVKGAGADAEKKEANIFSPADQEIAALPEQEIKKEEPKSKSTWPIVIGALLLMGGGYYYMIIYKPKKDVEIDLQDAMDMEDFEAENDEDSVDEDLYYEESKEEKERLLETIMKEEDNDFFTETEDEDADEEEGKDENN